MPEPIALFCHSDAKGGLELNIIKLAQEFRNRGRTVLLLLKEDSPLHRLAIEEELPFSTVHLRNKRLDVFAARHIAKILKSQHIRFLLSATSQHNYIAAFAKRWFMPHLTLLYYQQMQLGGPKKGLLQNWVNRALDYWLAPLNSLAQQAKEWTITEEHKIRIVPLGIDPDYFNDCDLSKEMARSQTGLPQDIPLMGIIGRLDPLKNQDLVVEALSKIKHKSAALVIIGEETLDNKPGYAGDLYRLVKDNGLEDRVILKGFVADVRPMIKSLDILIMATSKETYGMVTVEGMAMGKIIVGANGGGTPELLEEGKAGLLFEPGNAQDLSKKIDYALAHLENPELARRAKQRVAELYSFDKAFLEFNAILEA